MAAFRLEGLGPPGNVTWIRAGQTAIDSISAAALKDRFRNEGDRLGVRIYAQREDLFNAMHRI